MAENWDLNAVVRSCAASASSTAAANTTANNPLACLASLSFEEEDLHPFGFPNLVVPRKSADLDELQGLYKPFIPTTTTTTDSLIASASFSSGFRGSNGGHHHHQHAAASASASAATISPPFASMSSKNQAHQEKQEQEGPRPDTSSAAVPIPRMQQSLAPRSRKRKVHLKRTVCHVTAENLSADLWAWRKYGQKPIKGSPYPRNYYKCSSCKGCAARKQVERSTTDADIFIVTYTGDHTHPIPAHRNSLAGSTRNKATIIPKLASSTATATESPLSATSLSPTTPLRVPTEEEVPNQKSNNGECRVTEGIEEENENNEVGEDEDEDEDEDVLIENTNTAMTEDMFLGLQQLWFRDGGADAGASTGGGS